MKAFEARHLIRHDFHGNWNYALPAIPAEQATYCAVPKVEPVLVGIGRE